VLFDPLLVFEVEQRVLYLATPAPTTIDQKLDVAKCHASSQKKARNGKPNNYTLSHNTNLFLGSIAIDIKHQASKRE
jgi:hypothetical protein